MAPANNKRKSVPRSNSSSNKSEEAKEEEEAKDDSAAAADVSSPVGDNDDDGKDTVTTKDVAAEDDDDDAGVNVLSEEQTNAALAALRDASSKTIVIEAKDDDGATTGVEEKALENEEADETKEEEQAQGEQGKKRKAEEQDDDGGDDKKQPAAKRRSTPTRVSWADRMEMLRAYKAEHGNLLIPIRYKLNPSLGKFVHNTREQYKLYHKRTPAGYKKKCSLTKERIEELESLGFIWSTERTKRQNEDWEARLQQLKDYKAKHGNCLVPHGYDEDHSFAEWIHRQRTTYATHIKEGKPNPLVEDRIKKLQEVGFNFRVHVDKWTEHFEQLKAYREKHGHCMVPTHFSENPKLGRWVHTQRHQRRLMLKGKKSSMTQERVDLLNSLEFSWEVRPSLERPRATWQQRYDEVKQFHEAHGDFLVPAGVDPQLHSWCQEQKQRLKNIAKNNGKDSSKRMGPERIKMLAAIGFTKDIELAPAPPKGHGPTAAEELSVEEEEEQEERERDSGGEKDGGGAEIEQKRAKVSVTFDSVDV